MSYSTDAYNILHAKGKDPTVVRELILSLRQVQQSWLRAGIFNGVEEILKESGISIISIPGFDTSIYPGNDAMQTWWEFSPYYFTGYYLKSPCHSDSSWMGNLDALKNMGWGLGVIYVGQQTLGSSGCGQNNLSNAQGIADAQNAITLAKNEGMNKGAVVFLDIEEYAADSLPPEMIDYYSGWVYQFITDGTYVPGVYCVSKYATQLSNAGQLVYNTSNLGGAPVFWVANTSKNFNISMPVFFSGCHFARIWQGKQSPPPPQKKYTENYRGVTIEIDVDVSTVLNPSYVV